MDTWFRLTAFAICQFVLAATAWAQTPSNAPLDGREGRELSLRNFRPEPALKVPETSLSHAKFPVVDIHTHFRFKLEMTKDGLDPDTKLADFLKIMDRNNIALCNSLDGRLGETLDDFREHQAFLHKKYADRFLVFVHIDFQGSGKAEDPATWDCQREDFARSVALKLAQAKKEGAAGVKFFKSFGLTWRNPDGSLIRVDDRRWDAIWAACGELGLPVLIHSADPGAFFSPIDEKNERWEELSRHPDWSFYGKDFPRRAQLHAQRNKVIERFPKTNFIAAHMGNDGEDLKELATWLDKYPNLYIDTASRISELGRQPYTARKFFLKYQDRILFGTDGPWPEDRLRYYWRFFETFDEYFPYSEKEPPPQGFWQIYGIGLPDDVLRKLYHENAAKIVPGVKEKLTAYESAAKK